MGAIISKCGYRCDLCPAYESNLKSEADKQRMAHAWAKYLGSKVKPEEITRCGGCQTQGKQGDENCPVRPCASERGIENCAHCEEFVCDKLEDRMDLVEKNIKDRGGIPKEDYNVFIKPFLSRQRLGEIRKSLQAQ